MIEVKKIVDEAPGMERVSGFLHVAPNTTDGLVLTHGAGGNCGSPLLVALAEQFCASGITVLRCDLPFRQKRPKGPPSAGSGRADQQGLRRALDVLRSHVAGRVFLGGASYGGRQASHLAAADPCAEGLLLLSYPLHPPGRAAQVRTAHFPNLHVPALFVSGTRDPFGSPEELEKAGKILPEQRRLLLIEGAGHDLWPKARRFEIPLLILKAFQEFFGSGRK
ncbi:MAG TPA: alpha/beta family hydrolase [Terriglobales bacterium]|nr:alpha/beta family hydrolase [Terriglobales bacterium]